MTPNLRLLLCSHNALVRELGAPKVLLELGQEMSQLGWDVSFIAPRDLGMEHTNGPEQRALFADRLREHLHVHAGKFDVVDFEHEYLPFPRAEFASRTLLVARSVLLVHHLQTIPVPTAPGARALLGRLLHGKARRLDRDNRIARATQTMREADLVNVSNDHDKDELMRRGIAAAKIVVIPFGIKQARLAHFAATPPQPNTSPTIAFVGTFDFRKGAREFPALAAALTSKVPTVRFKLLGTQGQFRGAEPVLAAFGTQLRDRIEVHPTFDPEQLPNLLADCAAGVFPSHIEGFGFGVLEMLAAGLPVIAYDAPGPPMMLPAEWLVPRGNSSAMAQRVLELLQIPDQLAAARFRARQIAERFTWESAARMTDRFYRQAVEDKVLSNRNDPGGLK
jgi:glycosyltransferase involved in cell wall biosynthesis